MHENITVTEGAVSCLVRAFFNSLKSFRTLTVAIRRWTFVGEEKETQFLQTIAGNRLSRQSSKESVVLYFSHIIFVPSFYNVCAKNYINEIKFP